MKKFMGIVKEDIDMNSLPNLTREILSLPAKQRADIANLLIQSLDVSEDYEDQWIAEVEKRIEKMEAGKVTPISWNEIESFITGK